ncbi:MAG: hypothetical protein KDA60_16905, partial [Planctomycetales bacterium]|nr:hypothetical protein [Planctomycetales bacterium]
MHYITPNGTNNFFDGGPAFFGGLGAQWSLQVLIRRVHSANASILFDARNADSTAKFYLLIENDTDGRDIVLSVNNSSHAFGPFPQEDQDWQRLHFERNGTGIICTLNGVQVGTTWTSAPGSVNAASHDKSTFLANYFGSSGYFGGDVGRFSVWNSSQPHDTVVTPDYCDWFLKYRDAPVLTDNVAGKGPYTVNSLNTDTFFDWENSRENIGRKLVYPYKSCGNTQGPYPLNINN